MEIIYKKTNELIPYINNSRTHNESQIKQICASINEFGFTNPVLIDEKGMIIAGHGRIKAAEKLNMEEVPCIVLSGLTEAQKKAYVIADNKMALNAGWDEELLKVELETLKELDFDLEMTGFSVDELDSILGTEEEKEVEEDDFEIELPEEPKAKLGDIYQLGNHRLMCGDSTSEEDVEKLMNGKFADLIVTDPPYNVDYSSKNEMLNYSDNGSRIEKPIENDNIDNFEEFLSNAYKNMVNNTKQGGAFYIWHSEKEDVTFKTKLIESGVYIHQTLIWVKNNFVLGRMDYQPKHEPCLYGWKLGSGHYFIDNRSQTSVIEDEKPDIKKMKKEDLVKLLEEIYSDKVSTTIIKENKPQVSDLHPTMKPLKLLAKLINNSSKPKEIVLDLFGGSGSTLMTCEQLDRINYSMEYDPHYVDVIINRWEQYTGKKAVLIESKEEIK